MIRFDSLWQARRSLVWPAQARSGAIRCGSAGPVGWRGLGSDPMWSGMAGGAWKVSVRCDAQRSALERFGRYGRAGHGAVRNARVRWGKARQARYGEMRHGVARSAPAGKASSGWTRTGMDRRGRCGRMILGSAWRECLKESSVTATMALWPGGVGPSPALVGPHSQSKHRSFTED